MSYLDELFSLANRTAVVTGGSSGIGYGIAEALGRAGARVVLVARSADRLDSAAARLRERSVRVETLPADLAQREQVAEVADEIVRLGAEPDILVTAAGVNLRPTMDDLGVDVHDATMAINLDAPFLLGQRFGPAMATRGWGRIINIGSQQSFRAFGNSGAYGVSKAAICGLTRSQAEAWSASGVCCNTIVPGFVQTPLTADTFAVPGRAEQLARRTMTGRNGRPDDFAAAALFLAGPGSGYVTGQTLCVDGGFSVT